MKNQIIKRSLLSVLALAFLGFPLVAKADTFTFSAPATTPNNNSNTNNPSQSDYQGGANQFNLDHHLAYTWRVSRNPSSLLVPPGHEITSATLTITSIRNWDANANRLFIHLFDTANDLGVDNSPFGVGWHTPTIDFGAEHQVTAFIDVPLNQAPVQTIQDAFLSSNPLIGPGTGNTLLASPSFTTAVTTYTLQLNATQLAALAAYIANGNDFAFGFDADCHFWNNGITFTYTTAPTATPEPTTMLLLGSGLLGFGYFQRRRRRH